MNSLRKLFKDLCGIYPIEAIDNLVEEITEMVEEVKESYDQYAQLGRFLKGEDDEETDYQSITDTKDLPIILESLPNENDDQTILSVSQVERIIINKGEETHNFLKQQLGISGRVKRISVLAQKISENQLTRKRLEQFL
ncbi:hypothetical protein VB691_23075, partial [Crocosphaera sp. XPORK-15E]|nr:hypothetical protein [Crocosphaera sp. XPORK-15E]